MIRKTFIKKACLLLLSFGLCVHTISSAEQQELSSPNGRIKVQITLSDEIHYTVSYDDTELLTDCGLQLCLQNEVLGKNPALKNVKRDKVSEIIKPVVPLKFSRVTNEYNQMRLNFKSGYAVEFRAFDDGIAYRWVTNKKGNVEVLDETIAINFPADYQMHMQQTKSFKTAYEAPYVQVGSQNFAEDGSLMCNLPILFDTGKQYKILFSEAELYDYPCAFLKGAGENRLAAVYPKAPLEFGADGDRSLKILKEADYIAKTSGTRSYPWRYFVLTKHDGELVENTMSLKLSSPSAIEDTDWIVPGQASWEWWNVASPYGPDVNFVSGFNLETYKYYIDFAAKFGVKYIVMDEGWAKTTSDPYTPNPKVDVHEIIRYGKEKNVGVVLWLTWLAVENHFELFKTFSEWGVKGIKIDFMNRSDQWMVNYYERVAKEAVKYKLFVDFHGSFKPAGLEYKYPNVLSYEGVRGMEQMGGCTPRNSLYLPFIRNAVGAMDYTPGAMFSMQPEAYAARRPNSGSIGTRAYQLALFVVFESGLQMLADNPTLYYNNAECTEFITNVPTTWDETIALQAKAGEYLIAAKRKGEKWYIGGIMSDKEKEKTFELKFPFLKAGKTYHMTYFEDGINAGRQAMDYRRKAREVNNIDTLTIKMVRNGGWAAVIE